MALFILSITDFPPSSLPPSPPPPWFFLFEGKRSQKITWKRINLPPPSLKKKKTHKDKDQKNVIYLTCCRKGETLNSKAKLCGREGSFSSFLAWKSGTHKKRRILPLKAKSKSSGQLSSGKQTILMFYTYGYKFEFFSPQAKYLKPLETNDLTINDCAILSIWIFKGSTKWTTFEWNLPHPHVAEGFRQ